MANEDFRKKISAMPLNKWNPEHRTRPDNFVTFIDNYSLYLHSEKLSIYLENDLTSADLVTTLTGPDINALYDKVTQYHKNREEAERTFIDLGARLI